MAEFRADQEIEFRPKPDSVPWTRGRYVKPDGDYQKRWHWVAYVSGAKICVPITRIRNVPPVLEVCPTSKPRHADSETARRAAITAGRRASMQLSFYSCEKCAGYHLTKKVGGNNPVLVELAGLKRYEP